MSNDQPPPGQPPEDDPFRKRPPDSQPPPSGGPQEPPPPQGPPSGSPYGPGPGSGPGYGSGGSGPYDGGGGQPPPPGSGYGGAYGGADPLAGMPPLADFGKRFVARVIDALIVFVPLAVISLIFGGWDYNSNNDSWDEFTDQVNSGRQWLWSLISVVAYVAYDAVMVTRNGQTVGMRLMKIRVAMLNDGSVPDTSSSLLRALVLWVPALVCCFCLWWIIIILTILSDKPYKQGLHDKAGKTVVVSAPQ
ncbi:RDD family protein [Streptomyces sp. NBC_00829]|uniref:RDD family protein n=1 Tax=Streptomyces sp. NBC_00829 TaxID=2903679 RepID=UPI003870E21D|nr:RDD family protein [Streptomyces sp. NBC_00829]